MRCLVHCSGYPLLDIIGRLRVDNEKAFLIKKDYQELKILLAEDEKEYYNLKERFMKAVYGMR